MKVLLIDIETKRADELNRLLQAVGAETALVADTDDDIYTLLREVHPEIVIMDVDSPTRDTLEHVAALQTTSLQPVLMLAKQDNISIRRLATEIGISLYVVDALSPELIQSLIDVTIAHFRSYETLKREISTLEQTLKERQQIEAAKCFLMEKYQLAESQAYELLRKNAMQQRLSIALLAKKILAALPGSTDGAPKTRPGYAANGPL